MKTSITKNKWFWVVLVVVALAALGNILGLYDKGTPVKEILTTQIDEPSDNTIAYEVVTSEDYGVGLKNHSFRVIVDEKATDEQLLWVYSQLNNSKYEEVTIWFYKSKSSIENGVYDVAMVERKGTAYPTITR
ncbi:MAG: hypothetical protein PWQ70_3202 [Clostridiales bacterium]|jgi:hypothetical protein|nr:hypothetical protein [Clostridiales bacterium]